MSPRWLEQKMHWHGPAAIVDDFYTALHADDDFVPTGKLLLQAFKMAEGTALALPHAGALAAQMLARTQAVSALGGGMVDEGFQEWWRDQVCLSIRHLFVVCSYDHLRFSVIPAC